MFDGVANASSVFSGKAVGEKNPGLLKDVLRHNFQWTTLFVVVMTAFIALFEDMSAWLLLFPLVAGYGLTVYGIFTGTGTTRPVRNSSIATLMVFLLVAYFAVEAMGNHGLWLAFTLFYVGRFAFLYPSIYQVKEKCL